MGYDLILRKVSKQNVIILKEEEGNVVIYISFIISMVLLYTTLLQAGCETTRRNSENRVVFLLFH